jgi:hypothetical protein
MSLDRHRLGDDVFVHHLLERAESYGLRAATRLIGVPN